MKEGCGLLRQPGGFEGFLLVPESLPARDLAVAQCDDRGEWSLKLDFVSAFEVLNGGQEHARLPGRARISVSSVLCSVHAASNSEPSSRTSSRPRATLGAGCSGGSWNSTSSVTKALTLKPSKPSSLKASTAWRTIPTFSSDI